MSFKERAVHAGNPIAYRGCNQRVVGHTGRLGDHPDEILASIKADVQRIIATTAFEPNNQTRWQVTKSGISSYLQQRYRQGDLHGETSGQAYWVKVGLGATMTEQDVAEGRMIVELGVLLTAADVQPSGRAVGIKPSDYTTLTFTEGTGAD